MASGLARWGWEGAAALACLLVCENNGREGLYLFDTGINYDYGWRIHEGQIPFVDIETPLAPLSGILTDLGFRMFGVTYLSSVHVAAVLSAVAMFTIALGLRRIVPRWFACLLAFVSTITTLPMIGTLYYNHLGMLLVLLWHVAVIGLVVSTGDDEKLRLRWIVSAWTLTALLALNKVHIGLLFGGALALVEMTGLRRDDFDPRRIPRALAFRALAPFATALLVLGWARGDLHRVLWNLRIPSAPSAILNDLVEGTLGVPVSLYDVPWVATSLCFFIAVPVAILAFRRRREDEAGARLVVLLFLSFVIQRLSLLTTKEAGSGELSGALALLFVASALAVRNRAPDSQQTTGDPALGIIAGLATFMGLFALIYGASGLRKSYDLGAGTSLSGVGLNTAESNVPFFRGVRMRPEQASAIDRIGAIASAAPEATIYFGPELEMLYGATHRTGPHPWPLWIHPGVSVSRSEFSRLGARFAEARYDIVILSSVRAYLTPYLEAELRGSYRAVPMRRPDFLAVHFRSDFQPSPALVAATR